MASSWPVARKCLARICLEVESGGVCYVAKTLVLFVMKKVLKL